MIVVFLLAILQCCSAHTGNGVRSGMATAQRHPHTPLIRPYFSQPISSRLTGSALCAPVSAPLPSKLAGLGVNSAEAWHLNDPGPHSGGPRLRRRMSEGGGG